MVEDVSDQFAEGWFGDDDGNLYKPDGPGADWTRFDAAGFVKKNHEDEADWSDVRAAIAALHADRSDAAAWRAGLEATFDADGFLRWLAANQAMENWDTYGAIPHNYYLYAHGGRLVWIPWDHNEALRESRTGDPSFDFSRTGDRWPLIRFLVDDPEYRGRYRAALRAFLDGPYAEAPLFARMRTLHALVAPSVARERAPFTQLQQGGLSAFEGALERELFPHVRGRRALAEAALSAD
jgi:spore coat protein CotH